MQLAHHLTDMSQPSVEFAVSLRELTTIVERNYQPQASSACS